MQRKARPKWQGEHNEPRCSKKQKQPQISQEEVWTNSTCPNDRKGEESELQSEPEVTNQIGREYWQEENLDFCETGHIEGEIKSIFSSFFRIQNVPSQIIFSASKAVSQQVAKVIAEAVQKEVSIRNKGSVLPVRDILGVMHKFSDHYKNKAVKTLMVEQTQKKNHHEIRNLI